MLPGQLNSLLFHQLQVNTRRRSKGINSRLLQSCTFLQCLHISYSFEKWFDIYIYILHTDCKMHLYIFINLQASFQICVDLTGSLKQAAISSLMHYTYFPLCYYCQQIIFLRTGFITFFAFSKSTIFFFIKVNHVCGLFVKYIFVVTLPLLHI